MSQGHGFTFEKFDMYQVTIKPDFSIEANFCKDGKNCDNAKIKGTW